MRVSILTPHDDVQRLAIDIDQELGLLRQLGRGEPFLGSWSPPAATRLFKPRKRKIEDLCDLTAIGAYVDLPVISSRAKSVLEPALGSQAQWLPVAFPEAEYWILNSVHTLDALDRVAAEIRFYPHGPVMNIHTYAFQSGGIDDEWLFKLLPAPYDVLVTDKFHQLIEAHGLTGFYFAPVWDSGYSPFPARPTRAELLARPEVFGPGGIVMGHEGLWPADWKEQARQMRRQSRKNREA